MDKDFMLVIKEMKDNFTPTCEAMSLVAELEYVKFTELQKAGFTRQEAFAIVKERGVQ